MVCKKYKLTGLTAILSLLIIIPSITWAESYKAKVVRITDGDTITVIRNNKQQVKIRLAGIDCPERRQPWGTRAKQAATELVANKIVTIKVLDVDRYGRTVGQVFVDSVNVNRELVLAGHCWAYTKYVRDSVLFSHQNAAQKAKRGLWGLPKSERIPPWEWRRKK
jgi:endonuclease YncB( thermonuclease family)